MKTSPVESSHFKDEVKRLSRKYHHIEDDLQKFYQGFLDNPLQGTFAIPGYERKIWKVRMRSSDQQRGKSGGFRIIFYFDESKPGTVHLLTIYPKSEREDLSATELWELYKRFMQFYQQR